MDPIPNSNELLLGQLIAKADASLESIRRVNDSVRELTGYIQSVERDLGTRIAVGDRDLAEKISTIDRDLGSKIANNAGRIVLLETGDNHKKQNFTLLVALAGLAGSLSSLAKMFGLL